MEERGGEGRCEGVGGRNVECGMWNVGAERKSDGAMREGGPGAESRKVIPSRVGMGGRGVGSIEGGGRSGSRGRRRNESSLGDQNSGRQALRSRKGGASRNGIKTRLNRN